MTKIIVEILSMVSIVSFFAAGLILIKLVANV